MTATVKFMQVKNGDAICLRFFGDDQKYHNIFIDGGFADTYVRTLQKEARRVVDSGEKIDLFIITHTDLDHISGVLKFVKEFGNTDLVEKYWYNYSKSDVEVPSSDSQISIGQGIKLRDYLEQQGRLSNTNVTDEIFNADLFGAKLTVFSPSLSDLKDYQTLWDKEATTSDSKDGLIAGEKDDYECSIEQLIHNKFQEDTKLENRISISVLFQFRSKSILFLADSQPSSILNSLTRLGYSRSNKLKVDYVKLAHHGSKANTSAELLSCIECYSFVISANGRNHPHKEVLARILKNPDRELSKPIHFVFNYNNAIIRNIFTDEEREKYNFACFNPNEGDNGYTVQL